MHEKYKIFSRLRTKKVRFSNDILKNVKIEDLVRVTFFSIIETAPDDIQIKFSVVCSSLHNHKGQELLKNITYLQIQTTDAMAWHFRTCARKRSIFTFQPFYIQHAHKGNAGNFLNATKICNK